MKEWSKMKLNIIIQRDTKSQLNLILWFQMNNHIKEKIGLINSMEMRE